MWKSSAPEPTARLIAVGILFEAKARLASSSKVDREKIRNHLEEIGLDVLVDIRLLD